MIEKSALGGQDTIQVYAIQSLGWCAQSIRLICPLLTLIIIAEQERKNTLILFLIIFFGVHDIHS